MTLGITVTPHLEPAMAREVEALAAHAASSDGVAPLSEASRLALAAPSPEGTRHLLAEFDGALLGYAQIWPDDSAELVVSPATRRLGIGSTLWQRAAHAGAARVWAHGDLDPARGLAARTALQPVRSLLKMGRPLTAADRSPRPLPPGYAALTFADRAPLARADGVDPMEELAALNAAAFAGHPEQGRLTVADLEARMAEPWFDPGGLIYVVEEHPAGRSTAGAPVAFHWTKIEPGSQTGEVYVVGVSPAYQGRGLAGPLTDLGLAHLAEQGCTAVELYVDGGNAPARATYERAGLTVLVVDRVYAPSATRGQD